MPQLVRAHFERPLPDVNVRDGAVKIRYPSYSPLNWLAYWRQALAERTIYASIPWSIEVRTVGCMPGKASAAYGYPPRTVGAVKDHDESTQA